ncbi:uncharacterized protein LTR77_002230 [Saxophila tyrrhenica]|uniref:Uncharacterized protein n=1 Tax=Saxophila tyrrhenica TaxID=1690608 RepID=A0AAV9PI01_9PEZI|nr:hypothetical protein LTR77_002230 [Saxophila tyrrhenica]
MSDENQPQSPPNRDRRSSFAGQTFADLFGPNRGSTSKPSGAPDSTSPPTQQLPGPISQAAAQAQRRRMSLTTLGLSGSPNQTSPFGSYRGGRRDSIGSANSGSFDDSAIAEEESPARDQNDGSNPHTPFARRTSFGARALRDIRTGSFSGGGGSGGPGSPGQNGTRSPPASSNGRSAPPNGTISSRDSKGRGSGAEGFNWADNFRTRAERTSIAAQGNGGVGLPAGSSHARAKSVAVMEPPPAAPPKAKEQKRPDHFQERILKGDFYMD